MSFNHILEGIFCVSFVQFREDVQNTGSNRLQLKLTHKVFIRRNNNPVKLLKAVLLTCKMKIFFL